MGLDMDLYRMTKVDGYTSRDYNDAWLTHKDAGIENVATWRKVYPIDEWLGGQSCLYARLVDKETLVQLLAACDSLLDDPSGWWFEPEDMRELKEYTKTTLRGIIDETNWETQVILYNAV